MTKSSQTWVWIWGNLALWPVAFGVAELAGLGQDAAGAGMYGGMAFIATIVLLGLPISFRIVRLLRNRGEVTGLQRATGLLSVALVFLVAIPMLGLLVIEGYWWQAVLIAAVVYIGFFGWRRPIGGQESD